jgi:aldehyde:ferredoxin oxidoreductase
MPFGWAGNILYIDLTKGKIRKETIPKDMFTKFLGGRGVNAKILWDMMKPGIDSLSPDNVLIFGAGALTGTNAPSSGRMTVTFKSPATNLYAKSTAGGHWGAELKFAGYDNIVIIGASTKPVYLWIDDKHVEIKDAGKIWGKNVRETDKMIKEELGDEEIKIACIGPAGENMVKFAAVMNSVYNAAARCGGGAVMGSKKLKAIAVRGTGTIEVADPETFDKLAIDARKSLAKDSGAQGLYLYGTAGFVPGVNEQYAFPSYNFRAGQIDGAYYISGQYQVEGGYLKRRHGCFSCTISCHRFTSIDSGPYAGAYAGGPEYETTGALGAGCGHTDLETIIKANELCNIYGLDTISTGAVIQWAMECYEKGIITEKDTDGLILEWGNSDAILGLINKIAFREGFGNILAEGTKKASEIIGKDSWKFAVQAKGLEQSRVETRAAKGYALAFAVNPRGPDHLHTEVIAEFGLTPEAIALIEKITGDKKYARPDIIEKRAEIVRWHEDCYAVTDSLGFCAFATTLAYAVNPDNMAKMFTAATGIKMTEEEIMNTGRRIVTLERCFNVREGASRKDDVLPYRLMNEPAPAGPVKGMMNSPQELNKMLDEYYSLHEWDTESGWPTAEVLEKLKLKEVAMELEQLGRLPSKERRKK